MSIRQHAITIGLGLLVAGLLVAVWLVSAVYQLPDSTSDAMGLGILLATFALGTYAKVYRVGWREVAFIVVANSAAMVARVRFDFPHGVVQVYIWVIAQIFVLFFWAARRRRKQMGALAVSRMRNSG